MAKCIKKQPKKSGKRGFTIIEVVLVLAIAGLIFLMVFIALPALQSSQRNTQREEDLSRFLTAVTDYQSNNSGRLPFNFGGAGAGDLDPNFVPRYIDDTCTAVAGGGWTCVADQFRDPDGSEYNFELATKDNVNHTVDIPEQNDVNHIIYYVLNAMCGANERTYVDGSAGSDENARQVAVYMILEGGAVTCNSNS